jgi:uncharacterized membrane protein
MRFTTLLTILALALAPAPVFAYIGPSAGLGAIATLIAILLGIILLIVGFLWYPLKRALKKKQEKTTSEGQTSPERSD